MGFLIPTLVPGTTQAIKQLYGARDSGSGIVPAELGLSGNTDVQLARQVRGYTPW